MSFLGSLQRLPQNKKDVQHEMDSVVEWSKAFMYVLFKYCVCSICVLSSKPQSAAGQLMVFRQLPLTELTKGVKSFALEIPIQRT